jgi:hypothetical protein
MGVHDLKLEFNICDPFGFKQLGVTDERAQTLFDSYELYYGNAEQVNEIAV